MLVETADRRLVPIVSRMPLVEPYVPRSELVSLGLQPANTATETLSNTRYAFFMILFFPARSRANPY